MRNCHGCASYIGRPVQGSGRRRILHNPVACNTNEGYYRDMAKVKKFELEEPVPVVDDEDEETLTAIDEGIRDADVGRTLPSEEVRKLLPRWISASSTRKER